MQATRWAGRISYMKQKTYKWLSIKTDPVDDDALQIFPLILSATANTMLKQ